jgi:hypothetical protein
MLTLAMVLLLVLSNSLSVQALLQRHTTALMLAATTAHAHCNPNNINVTTTDCDRLHRGYANRSERDCSAGGERSFNYKPGIHAGD